MSTREQLSAALTWVVGGQPNKRDPSRDRGHDLAALLAVGEIATSVGATPDQSHIEQAARAHALRLASAFSDRDRALATILLEPDGSIGSKERDMAELLRYADARSVRPHRDRIIRMLADAMVVEPPSDTTVAAADDGPDIEPNRRSRVLLIALALGATAFLAILISGRGGADPLSFSVTPPECSVDVCNSETAAIVGISSGFTPEGTVSIKITTPDGTDANELAGPYSYGTTPAVRLDGSFTWRYWWDPGMATGVYTTVVTDVATGRSITRSFTFLPPRGGQGGKSAP